MSDTKLSPHMVAALRLASVSGVLVTPGGGAWCSSADADRSRGDLMFVMYGSGKKIAQCETGTVRALEKRGLLARTNAPGMPEYRDPRHLTEEGWRRACELA